jgi:hypothetical protein
MMRDPGCTPHLTVIEHAGKPKFLADVDATQNQDVFQQLSCRAWFRPLRSRTTRPQAICPAWRAMTLAWPVKPGAPTRKKASEKSLAFRSPASAGYNIPALAHYLNCHART